MKNLTVHLDDKPIYDIVYEESFDALPSMIKELGYSNRKICVVSESHVASLYLDAILHSIKDACTYTTSFVFPEGEASKNLNVVRDLYTHLIEEKFDRNDVLIALGGGVVGDLTGYAAATYLRGIDFIQIPTSLLSQVDSSIGGKTGVDFDSYKNMVGAFHMPKLVYMNLSVLKTLSNRQFCSGMGEIIKHGDVGLVFQQFNLFPHFSVMKNIVDAPLKVQKRKKDEVYAQARSLLKKMGLADKEKAYPFQLSGGQQQRVSIARALCMNPKILFFDEPTSALDPQLTGEILKVIKDLAAEHMTMVIVTHEMNFARNVADHIVFMENGVIVKEGAPEELFTSDNQRIKEFLGKFQD